MARARTPKTLTRVYHSISMQNTALHARALPEKISGLYQVTIESIYINLELYYHDIDVQLLAKASLNLDDLAGSLTIVPISTAHGIINKIPKINWEHY